jgi:hypothetical protein
MVETTMDSEAVLAQFNRLMQELLRGNMNRNCFRPWEIELLLDIEDCQMRESNRRETLRRYQKAVQRTMEKGADMPFKFSVYLETQKSRKPVGSPTNGEQATGTRSSPHR